MAVNDVLYSDSGLTTLFNGNSQWYKIIWKGAVGTDDVYAVQISSTGVVLAWEYCPSTTTTTSTSTSTTTTTAAPTTTTTSTSTTSTSTSTTTAGPGLAVSNGTVTCSGTNGSFTTTASGGSGTYDWIAIDTTQANAISAVNGGSGTRYAMVGNTRLWSTIGNGTWYVAVKDSLGNVSYSSVVISCSTTTTSTSTSTSTSTTTAAPSSGPFNLDWSHGINYGTGLSTLLINKNGNQVVNSTTSGNGTITGIYSGDVITYSLVSSSPNFNRSAIIVTDADETYDTLIDCNLYMSNVSNTVGIQLNDNAALSAAADDYIDQCP